MQKPNKPILMKRLVIQHEENNKTVVLTGIYSNFLLKSIIVQDKIYEIKQVKSAPKPRQVEKIVIENVFNPNEPTDDVIVIPSDDGIVIPSDDGIVIPSDDGIVIPSDDVIVIPSDDVIAIPSDDVIPSEDVILIPSDDVIVKSNGTGKIAKKKPKKKKEKVVIVKSNDKSSKTENTIIPLVENNKEATIENHKVEPKKRKKFIEKPSTNSKRQKTIKPIVPSKNTLLNAPPAASTKNKKKNKVVNTQAYSTQTDSIPFKIVEKSTNVNVRPIYSWQSVYKAISFNAELPSGRVVSRDVWYTRIRSLGDDPREMSTNDCFLIKSEKRDVIVHIVGFWLDETARWMVTVLKYRKFSPDWIVGTVKDEDIALDMFDEKCAVLTLREYSRYKTALMRRCIGIGRYRCSAASSLLSESEESIERKLLDCDRCMPKSFVASGFLLL